MGEARRDKCVVVVAENMVCAVVIEENRKASENIPSEVQGYNDAMVDYDDKEEARTLTSIGILHDILGDLWKKAITLRSISRPNPGVNIIK